MSVKMVTQTLAQIGPRLWYETGANLSQSFGLQTVIFYVLFQCTFTDSIYVYIYFFCLKFVIRLQHF